jgi:predicted DNA binding CopG/RHH family protein
MNNIEVIADFLPSPEELAFKEESVKITIALSKSSVDFFKKKAESHRTQYQKMIRRLVDEYVTRQRRLSP